MAEWTPATAYLLRVTEREMREAWDDLHFYRDAFAFYARSGYLEEAQSANCAARAAEKAAELRTLARVRRLLKGRTR